jgi:peptide/nickel transport system permease protein
MVSRAQEVRSQTAVEAARDDSSRLRPPRRYLVLRRLWRDKIGFAGGIVFLLIVVATLAAPWVAPHDPDKISLSNRFAGVGSPGYLLGGDAFGRDLLSRIIWGGRASLMVGLTATVIAMSIGITIGAISGYLGGRVDMLIMRATEIMLAFPYILLAIVIVGALGPGLRNAMLAVAISGIPFYIRLMRGMVLSLREQQYVEAARALGATHARVLRRAILPSILPYIIVSFSINVGWLILEAAGLSFLGLGAQPPTSEWGAMLAEARNYVTVAPHAAIVPGLAIFVVVISLNLFGDALRDALDVRLRD